MPKPRLSCAGGVGAGAGAGAGAGSGAGAGAGAAPPSGSAAAPCNGIAAATAGDVACGDDNCSFQSRITNASVSGANLLWLVVDGYGMTSEGTYTLGYTLN